MEDLKRWTVTYTKHIRQKRKVYQDGFLELHISSKKALLYDDCDKLLECRLLKQLEEVSSGGTLEFNAHLVDVGDLHGDNMSAAGFRFQGNDKGDGKNVAEKSKARTTPRRTENITAGVKDELRKYGIQKDSLEKENTCATEWQVLYTAQLTRKNKRYHDGFLRVKFCGSQGRQAMLYDACRKLLEGRFLKKDELVQSGESITFDSHLIDIGDPAEKHEPHLDSHVQANNCNAHKRWKTNGQRESINAKNSVLKEWHVLYTTQITQKAKKYHSGILRHSSCSYNTEVTLISEDKTTLGSKHLCSSEDVRTGCTIQVQKYLVEVGDLYRGKLPDNAKLRKDDSDLGVSSGCKIKSSREGCQNKPLRDACAIMSSLHKPTTTESSNGCRIDNDIVMTASSTKAPAVMDPVVLDLADDKMGKTSTSDQILHEDHDLGESTRSSDCGRRSAEDVSAGNSNQIQTLRSDGVEADSEELVRNFNREIPNSSKCVSLNEVDYERKDSCDCPSFDLGF